MSSTEEDRVRITALLPPAPTRLLLPPHPVPAPRWGLWGLIVRRYRLLLFRPKKFFAGMTAPRNDVELLLLAYTVGLAGALSNALVFIARAPGSVTSRGWPMYWLRGLGLGVILAAVAYFVTAAIWNALIGWCGARGSDIRLVRRVCLSALQITSIPIIIKTLVDTLTHGSPLAAALADPTWQNRMFLVFPVWGFIVGFIGVRAVFRTRLLRTSVWFLVVPICAYLVLVLPALTGHRAPGPAPARGPAADVGHPREFSSPTMAFSYPGNWSVLTADRDYDPETDVQLRSVQDIRIRIRFIKPGEGPDGFAAAMAESIMNISQAATRPESATVWGRYGGNGQSFKMRVRGQAYVVRVFVAPVAETAYLSVTEILAESASMEVEPGFDLIRNTFVCRWE